MRINAYKCNLIPFKIVDYNDNFKDRCLLALGGYGMDLTPRLDAYHFLQTGKMDPKSSYFSQKDYFKSLVSDEIFNKIDAKFKLVMILDTNNEVIVRDKDCMEIKECVTEEIMLNDDILNQVKRELGLSYENVKDLLVEYALNYIYENDLSVEEELRVNYLSNIIGETK